MSRASPESNAPPFVRDLTASVVVFLVALPLCLGIAIASGAEPIAGLISGIVGGVLVGTLSGSHTSVSGPAAGLTAICLAQIAALGSFEAFLLAVVFGGAIQIVLGLLRGGIIVAYFPSSVIKGLLAAIGIILVMKQIPHLFGHDTDPEGEMSFAQPDRENTFSELVAMLSDLHLGAAIVGLASIALLVIWERTPRLKRSIVPAPLVVVLFGTALTLLFRQLGGSLVINPSHLVQVPIAEGTGDVGKFLTPPDFQQWTNPAIYLAGLTIAIVASLETLLNLEAVDRIDPRQRSSPPSRELWAQGVGNVTAGLLGGLPVTSVIVRSSVNVQAGAQTRRSAIAHGFMLLFCVMLMPAALNLIPLSCLAALLIITGVKLASPRLVRQIWQQGPYQFVPFLVTVVAIVFTDLLIGIVIGLAVAVSFVLRSNPRRPLRRVVEQRRDAEVVHIVLARQVSFLNRVTLDRALKEVPLGGHVQIDACESSYIDLDILELLREFRDSTGPGRGIQVRFLNFHARYLIDNSAPFVESQSGR